MATKQARGTKRTCQSCDERFYDLDRTPITCPFCNSVYVIASSPAALAALQAEQRDQAAKKAKKASQNDDADGELPTVEGEEALVDVEADDSGNGDDDETFLEEEEEEGGDVSNIIGGPAGEGDEES
ncbi:TIGR02300 family protein [Hyphomicrobium methylovorum]|uniref:TIGR02300 family protein n=1 Tax=Hyphomicrobium methylovorum TaxID=84 RepID=UPI0015E65EA2|nr:TIGR02300 family protein [Hyphomicrobium methylovorum]MBA2125574.1 TIGR02300 family protein [Hyphomicrobium methylovorum]